MLMSHSFSLLDQKTDNYVIFYYSVAVLLGVVLFIVLPLVVLLIKTRRMEPGHRFPVQPIVKQWEISRLK